MSAYMWRANLWQVGALAAVLAAIVAIIAILPVGGGGSRAIAAAGLAIPEIPPSPDLDDALKRIVRTGFTPNLLGDARPVRRPARQLPVKPRKQASLTRKNSPPRPLAIGKKDGLSGAYFRAAKSNQSMDIKFVGDTINSWTIIEIAPSYIRYRRDKHEVLVNIFKSGNTNG